MKFMLLANLGLLEFDKTSLLPAPEPSFAEIMAKLAEALGLLWNWLPMAVRSPLVLAVGYGIFCLLRAILTESVPRVQVLEETARGNDNGQSPADA